MSNRPYCIVTAAKIKMLVLSCIFSGIFGVITIAVGTAAAADMDITPFNTFNQSPLVQIYGLPHDSGADIVPPGKFRISLNQDLSSNYTVNSNTHEQITLDSEVYRLAFAARYGIAPRWEIGIEIPYIFQGGGFLDSSVVDWHNTFRLPQGGRDNAPRDRMSNSYSKNGIQKLKVEQAGSGIGDISLTSGFSLYENSDDKAHDQLALKVALKFPTGDSSILRGSGGTDFMLQLCGSMTNYSEWGSLGVYGSAGALAMSKGDVLPDQHNQLAGVGTLGIGWGPASWISFKVQLNGNTPLYHDSSLAELSKSPLLLVLGGALRLPGEYLLDIGVAEDLAVGSAPDVGFHLGLSKLF